MPCQMFARCTNDATGAVSHPVLDWVPSCAGCATTLNATLVPAIFEQEN